MQRISSRSTTILRYVSSFFMLLLCFMGNSSSARSDWRDDVDYTKLIGFLGDSAPNGLGVPISLVEATPVGSSAYFPRTDHGEFGSASDPSSIAVTFIDGSGGQSNGSSNHAFDQARRFFGNTTSVAPAANQVTIYEANDYLTDTLNLNGNNSAEPDVQDFRVQNFSWIGTFATPNDGTPEPTTTELNNDREALRRLDFAINRDNITALVGLNNGLGSLPHLLGHSYNSIAVGVSTGFHSVGLTHFDGYGIGRSKPDLVAPESSTSTATSITSSVATFLHSSDTVLGTDAARSQTMKAILLAGATKVGLPEPWSQLDAQNEWHPLDDTYGAGQLNIYNSYLTTLRGQAAGSSSTPTQVPSHGWDYQTVQPGVANQLLYDFVIPAGSTATELSIVLSWNAEISSANFNTGDPVLADLNLELVDDTGGIVDLNLGDSQIDGLSQSEVDNVEHLYLTDLEAGTYTLKVSSDDIASDFGLAWRTSTLFDSPSADFNSDGSVNGFDFFAWQRSYGKLVGATRSSGDADGDGDVDSDDLALFNTALSTGGTLPLLSTLSAVPEPSTLAIAVGSMLLLFRRHRNN